MKITRNNYESYFLDYLDGNLDEGLMNEFIDFLQKNPDLKNELHLAGSDKLTPDAIQFEEKSKLLKHKFDLPEEFNQAAVAWMEGDLDTEEKTEFEAWLNLRPSKRNELLSFEYTRLSPDKTILYNRKKSLYRIGKGRAILLWSTRIAAVLVLAIMVYRIAGDISDRNSIMEQQVIVTENTNEKPESASEPKQDVKKEAPVPAKDKDVTPEKNTQRSVQPAKSLRETNKGRMDHEKVAGIRMPVDIPERMPAIHASIDLEQVTYASLEPVNIKHHAQQNTTADERLLGDLVREKTGIDNLSVGKVARAGLNLVANLSGEKFSYETNEEGHITELNYDSRLLAFSIPTNQEK